MSIPAVRLALAYTPKISFASAFQSLNIRFEGESTGNDRFARTHTDNLRLQTGGTAADDFPPSKLLSVKHPQSGRPLQLRLWAPRGQRVDDQIQQGTQQNAVLLIPGLGGRSEWFAPLAENILQNQDSSTLVYSLQMPEVSRTLDDNPAACDVKDINKLVKDVESAIDYLGKHHQGKVFAVGASLGGLLLTPVAANPPESLVGISLVSPAYRPITSRSDKALLVLGRVLRRVGLLDIVGKHVKRRETEDQTNFKEHMPEGMTPLQQRIWHEKRRNIDQFVVTPGSALQMIDLMRVAREQASQINLPTQLFVGDTDSVIDSRCSKAVFKRIPASRQKEGWAYPSGEHDLVFDSVLPDMAKKMNHRIRTLLAESL